VFEVSANKRVKQGLIIDIYCLGCCDTDSMGEAAFSGLCEIMVRVGVCLVSDDERC